MNLLYLADLNSIHDIKWISFFAEKGHHCFVLQRRYHYELFNSTDISKNIHPVGFIEDYSSVRPWKNRKWRNQINEIIRSRKIDLFHILYAEPNVLWAQVVKNSPVMLTTRGQMSCRLYHKPLRVNH